jgi:hypothetical protein
MNLIPDIDGIWSVGWDEDNNMVPFTFGFYITKLEELSITQFETPIESAKKKGITILLLANAFPIGRKNWYISQNIIRAFSKEDALEAIKYIKEFITGY